MKGFITLFILWGDAHPMRHIMFLFLGLLGVLLACTLIFTIFKRKVDLNKKSWQPQIASLLSAAIFYTEADGDFINIIPANKKLFEKSLFRQCIINEIVTARKDLAGLSAVNLKELYEVLGLNKDSFKKLQSRKWHIVAKGIQELAVMEQHEYVKEIFRLTNKGNVYVRNEAQSALVNFYGFLGLRFLNVTVHQISEWQQIQLLNKLHGVTPQHSDAIKKWLRSSNESVVVFALKLATFYNRYELYEDVIECLVKRNVVVKFNALNYLKNNPHPDTVLKLIEDYCFDDKAYKLAIIAAIKDIGNETQVAFLLKQLNNSDNDIKVAAAKALSIIHPSGPSFLQTQLFANENPWKAIFLQIQNERAA